MIVMLITISDDGIYGAHAVCAFCYLLFSVPYIDCRFLSIGAVPSFTDGGKNSEKECPDGLHADLYSFLVIYFCNCLMLDIGPLMSVSNDVIDGVRFRRLYGIKDRMLFKRQCFFRQIGIHLVGFLTGTGTIGRCQGRVKKMKATKALFDRPGSGRCTDYGK